MSDVPILTGGSVTLRPPRDADVAGRLALGRTAEIVHMFGGDPATVTGPITKAIAAAWVEDIATHPPAWVVEYDGRLLGAIRLHTIDAQDRHARLAIGLLDPAKLGRGIGRETIRLVLAHGFDTMSLHRIDLRVLAYNQRAIRCYQACGFVEEGRLRDNALIGGEWHDDIMMGLLAHEFERTRWAIGTALAVPSTVTESGER